MKILINYANWRSALARPYNSLAGRLIGGADRVIEYSPRDLPEDFRRRNRKLLRRIRGGGYWVWKPWIILETLKSMSEDDILLYSDADIFFLRSIDPLLERMEETGRDVMAFSLYPGALEKYWTKRDVFQLLNCDSPEYADALQTMSGFHLWKKTGFSMDLAREWLHCIEDERIVGDARNRCGLPNWPGFQENRHDQSIFSLLLKKRRLISHRNPSQLGIAQKKRFPADRYPQIIFVDQAGEKINLSFLLRKIFLPGWAALARLRWDSSAVRRIRTLKSRIRRRFRPG